MPRYLLEVLEHTNHHVVVDAPDPNRARAMAYQVVAGASELEGLVSHKAESADSDVTDICVWSPAGWMEP